MDREVAKQPVLTFIGYYTALVGGHVEEADTFLDGLTKDELRFTLAASAGMLRSVMALLEDRGVVDDSGSILRALALRFTD